jgi:hypothetical protein
MEQSHQHSTEALKTLTQIKASMTMLFNDWIGFLVVAGVFSAQAVNLLLPGFQGCQLEASILTQVCDAVIPFVEEHGK